MFRWTMYGTCQCKHQPTPKPPKQCQEVEGKLCKNGITDCGEDGSCIPNPM